MATHNDLLLQIEDKELRDKIRRELNKLNRTRKLGLVFEDHLPECTPLYDVGLKRNQTVAKKDGKIEDTYKISEIKEDVAICQHEADGEYERIKLSNLYPVARFGEVIYPWLKQIDVIENAPDKDLWHTLIEADNYHALQLLEYLYAEKVDCIYIDPPYNTKATDWKYNNNYVDDSDAYYHSKWLSFMEKRLKIAKKLLNPNNSVLIVTIDEKEYLHLGCLLESLFPEASMQMISSAINSKGVARGEFFRVNEYLFILRFGRCFASSLNLSDEWRGNIRNTTIDTVRWGSLMRSGSGALREDSPGCFFPIFISKDKKRFMGAGEVFTPDMTVEDYIPPDDVIAIFPIHEDGVEGRWQYSRDNYLAIQRKGYVRISTKTKKGKDVTLRYIAEGWQRKVEEGLIDVVGKAEDGSLIFEDEDYEQNFLPPNQWWISTHNATEYGSKLLPKFLKDRKFPFPKSLYAVEDVLRFFVTDKPNALIIDFFAGSGTTLHAVNLLNAEDGGYRRCIMVTNNEVSKAEAESLKNQGFKPNDENWEKLGIARYVTWPRTICSIKGVDVNGELLKDEYFTSLITEKEGERTFVHIDFIKDSQELNITKKKKIVGVITEGKLPQTLVKGDCNYIVSDNEKHTISILFDDRYVDEWIDTLRYKEYITKLFIITEKPKKFKEIKAKAEEALGKIKRQESVKIPMSQGFETNAVYFKLGFLDKDSVSLGRQFSELLPILWMKAGCHGKCPIVDRKNVPGMMVLSKNKFAVLTKDRYYWDFKEALEEHPEIDTVYIVTNSEDYFKSLTKELKVKYTYQLYKDYLDNFKINHI